MDQTAICTFKAITSKLIMAQIFRALDQDSDLKICQFWKKYTIKKGIENIDMAWREVDGSTMNGARGKLWPQCVYNFDGFTGL